MKKNYIVVLILLTFSMMAQPPAGYYNSATGTGYALKTQLKNIIDNHDDQGYGSLWNLYQTSAFRDNYYEDDNSLLDIYSENPDGTDPYEYTSSSDQCGEYSGEGDCYNREHLVPQSYFDGFQVNPMKNDPLHVVPSDGSVNGARGNYPFGMVGNATYTSQNGSKRGNNSNTGYAAGYSALVFEPIDEFKGDVARSFLYFATRYQDLMDDFYTSANASSTPAKNMFDGSIDKVFSNTFLNILLTWNYEDPVSAKEIAINNAVYNYQGNRNPFIDNPDYACEIWTSACTALNLSTDSLESVAFSIYPNPSKNNSVTIQTASVIDEIQLITINGQLLQQIKNPVLENASYSLKNIPQGFYLLKLTSNNQSVTKKVIVN